MVRWFLGDMGPVNIVLLIQEPLLLTGGGAAMPSDGHQLVKQRQNTVLKVGGVGREEHVWSEGCE